LIQENGIEWVEEKLGIMEISGPIISGKGKSAPQSKVIAYAAKQRKRAKERHSGLFFR